MLYNKDKPKRWNDQQNVISGRLITFEGIDGSGKTTQIALLADSLQKAGIAVKLLREPGGTAIGEAIRGILLDRAHVAMHLETELLLFAAARAQLVREIILPALKAGNWIICDRYYDSTLAYQGYGRGLDLDMITAINNLAIDQCRPDLTFYLDITVEQAFRRLAGRKTAADRLDQESQSFMQRARCGYHQIASQEPERMIIMNAEQSEQMLAQQIYRQIREGFGI